MADSSFLKSMTSDKAPIYSASGSQAKQQQNSKKAFYESDSDEEEVVVAPAVQQQQQQQQQRVVAQSGFQRMGDDAEEEQKITTKVNLANGDGQSRFGGISTQSVDQLSKDQIQQQPINQTTASISFPIIAERHISEADKQKTAQLESTIGEYRTQLTKLERLLKEDEEITNDPEKKEEVEKLRDQLKDSMILQLNELKFLQNSQVTLQKKLHADRVCEAYFQTEKTWYAALILEIFEETQEAEVAWIGYKSQEKLAKRYLNVLTPPNPLDLFEGAQCNAVFATDGMWYPCTVERIINDEQSSSDVSPELNAMLQKYLVKFKVQQVKATVPLDYIRITRDQMVANTTRKQQLLNGEDDDQPIGDFAIPEHLRMKRGDTEKIKLQKKKKVKALKYTHKVKLQEVDSKARQSTWLDFTNKATKSKAGHFAVAKNTESIFKSPDTIMGKVGVIGSGKNMTSYDAQKIKYHEKFKNEDYSKNDSLKEFESLSSLKRTRFN